MGAVIQLPLFIGRVDRYDGSMGDYFPDYDGNFLHFVGNGIFPPRICFVVFGPQQPVNGLKNIWISDCVILGIVYLRQIFNFLIFSDFFLPLAFVGWPSQNSSSFLNLKNIPVREVVAVMTKKSRLNATAVFLSIPI